MGAFSLHFSTIITACFAVAFFCRPQSVQAENASSSSVVIDTTAAGKPFPHFWEQAFGSGRADLVLTHSYVENAKATKKATDFRYVRFHGILDDSMGIMAPDTQGHMHYNFHKFDAVYDNLLRLHIRPYVELSFMPSLIGSDLLRRNSGLEPLMNMTASEPPKPVTDFSKGALWYRANVTPPAHMEEWNDLIRALVTHLEQRYGKDEVRKWPFEVWNEPDQATWVGFPRMESYFALYDNTARTIKSVDPALQVGGPSTGAIHWVGDFIDHVVRYHVPVDFISTHIYANDPPDLLNLPKSPENTGNTVCDATRVARATLTRSSLHHLPLYISEFGADWDMKNGTAERSWISPWLAETIRDCDGLAPIMSYWTFSDDFEEQGVADRELPGAYGLLSSRGIPKPAFNAFALLHQLGNMRLPVSPQNSDILATRNNNQGISLALWNRSHDQKKVMSFDLQGLKTKKASLVIIDEHHGTPQDLYNAMNRPATPTDVQTQALVNAAHIPEAQQIAVHATGNIIVLPPESLALLVVQ
ncbi:GH39 family glycosyl hydrolase [Acetobacter thailandicus]|uniref:Glycosyl hydrolases family 39 N-terminal catalytic domain-containing protein n=1 Tax=Acetobacter thailandicus TaxID=1502842 RepID=A0ABT3QD14_9PROT|nr:glycosyl hydrolase family 39 [Acetobacter thailandicus]MCX2563178.1 hypothetical protein [Acetobacter thailandicus]NHN93934.1 glycosyl hydrolase family 39 [Acetobacter thailandicus]